MTQGTSESASLQSASVAPRTSESQVRVRRHGERGLRTYIVAGVLLCAAMVAGGVIGAGVAVLYLQRHGYPVPPQPDALRKAIVERMGESMQLTPDEARALEDVVGLRMESIEKIRQTSREQIRAQFDNMCGDVEKVVGKDRCRLWMADREKRMHKRRPPPEGPDGSDGPPPREGGRHHGRDR